MSMGEAERQRERFQEGFLPGITRQDGEIALLQQLHDNGISWQEAVFAGEEKARF